jgi:hypothetical protein
MIEALGYVLAGLSLMVLAGVLILCYVVWRSNRRMDDAVEEAAAAANPGIWGDK